MVDKLNGMKDFPVATRLAGRLFGCLLYADDIVVFSNNARDLAKMLSVVEEFSLHHRFCFGIKKCAVLQSAETENFMLYNEPFAVVHEFVYLGIPFTSNGIAFQVHAQRMATRLQRAAYIFKNMG